MSGVKVWEYHGMNPLGDKEFRLSTGEPAPHGRYVSVEDAAKMVEAAWCDGQSRGMSSYLSQEFRHSDTYAALKRIGG